MRIKFPGSKKIKYIILMLLTFIVIGIFLKERNENLNKAKSQNQIEKSEIKEQKIDSKKIDEEKNKKFDVEYDKAYNAFFAKNYLEATNIATSIIEIKPKYYKAYNIRGIAKAYNGDYESGMKDINKALELKSDYGYARFNKALNYELYAHYDEALEWYNKALKVEEYVWSYYGIASIYGRRGNVQESIKYLKKAISLDEGAKKAAKTEKDFDPVRDSKDFQDLIK